jgi:hypothetical protein
LITKGGKVVGAPRTISGCSASQACSAGVNSILEDSSAQVGRGTLNSRGINKYETNGMKELLLLWPIKRKSLPRHVNTCEGFRYAKTDKPNMKKNS